jgi:hypothetical protein
MSAQLQLEVDRSIQKGLVQPMGIDKLVEVNTQGEKSCQLEDKNFQLQFTP